MMKDKGQPPMFGALVQVVQTGEIVEFVAYYPDTEVVEIKCAYEKEIHRLWRREVARITTEQELEYLKKNSN